MERKETNKRKKDALLNKRKINNTVYPITGTFQNCGLQQERKLQTVDGLTAVHWRKCHATLLWWPQQWISGQQGLQQNLRDYLRRSYSSYDPTRKSPDMTKRVNGPASWLDRHDLSIAPVTWYSESKRNPHCNGLVPCRVETTSVVWWVMEYGLIVLATPLAETQDMNLHPCVLVVGMAQLDDPERFCPKYWLQNITGTNVNILHMGFHLPTHDNCWYSKYPRMRMYIRPWTIHVHKIQAPHLSVGETTW